MHVRFFFKPVDSYLNYWFVGIVKYILTVEKHYTAVTMLSSGVALGLQLASYVWSKPMWFCQFMTSAERILSLSYVNRLWS